jgi:hypothetical protein
VPADRGERAHRGLATRLRGEVQSALLRDPEIDRIIPIYDSMSQT